MTRPACSRARRWGVLCKTAPDQADLVGGNFVSERKIDMSPSCLLEAPQQPAAPDQAHAPEIFFLPPSRGSCSMIKAAPPAEPLRKGVCSDKDSSSRAFIRGTILLAMARQPRPSHAQLQKDLGFARRSDVGYHIGVLVKEGLLARSREATAPVLTALGRLFVFYGSALIDRDNRKHRLPPWRQVICDVFGCYTEEASRAMRAAALKLDEDYALNRGDGLVRKMPRGLEAERKATCMQVLRAVRASKTLDGAARKCGIDKNNFRQRLDTIAKHAKKLVAL